ncbi:hypothetical protein lbkm_2166 [Lachnospiraceae bacterium KM106-2]|nr:hypothetical protein lbkm_2166 [Lachnospiraceae bacterium KM106-2]
MSSKKGFLLVCIMMVFTLCACSKSESSVAKNTKSFSEAVKGQKGDRVMFNDLADFEWENAYIFIAHKTKEEMEDVIGLKSDDISEFLEDDDAFNIVFLSGDKVVANVSGSPSTLGYDIDMGMVENYRRIRKENNTCEFGVSTEDEIVTLTCLRQDSGITTGGGCEDFMPKK